MNRLRACFTALPCAAALLLGVLPAASYAVRPSIPLVELARRLQDAPFQDRLWFARAALEEMASEYELAVEKTRPPRKKEDLQSYRRWIASSMAQADDLRRRSEALDYARSIDLVVDGPDNVRIIIDGRNVVVSSPRLDGPDRLGERIVERACIYVICDGPIPVGDDRRAPNDRWYAADPYDREGRLRNEPVWQSEPSPGYGAAPALPESQASPASDALAAIDPAADIAALPDPATAVVKPQGGWRIVENQGATFTTPDGLHFTFSDATRRDEKEAICLRLARDLNTLVEATRYLGQAGWPIEWDFLRFGPVTDGGQTLLLNAYGDAVHVDLLDVRRVTDIWPAAVTWMRNRVEGRPGDQYFPNADSLLDPPGTSSVPPPALPYPSADAADVLAPWN